jgi:alpha-glucuronidase
LIDDERYDEVLVRLQYQAGHAIVWRDAVCQWFLKTSGIPDRKGRAGIYPGRIEAESMELEGYEIVDVTPWEGASYGKAIRCSAGTAVGRAAFVFDGKPGWYDLAVEYFDQANGSASYRVLLKDQVLDEWIADDLLPTRGINSHSSCRRRVQGVALRPGDRIRIEGRPDGGESAALDYIEILVHQD